MVEKRLTLRVLLVLALLAAGLLVVDLTRRARDQAGRGLAEHEDRAQDSHADQEMGRPSATPSSGLEPMDVQSVPTTPFVSLPQDEPWLSAEEAGGEIQPPRRISGPDFDPGSYLEGQSYSLSTCFLGLIVAVDGSVERVYFLAPRDASAGTREHFSSRARQWRFEPALRGGEPVRVRLLISVLHCRYARAAG